MSSSTEKNSAELLTTRLVAATNFAARLPAPAPDATHPDGPRPARTVPAIPWPGGPVPLLAYVVYSPHAATRSTQL